LFKGLKVATLVVAGSLALAACGSSTGSGASSSATGATDTASSTASACTPSDVKVGMAYDIGGRGDKSFNDSAAAGLDQAVKDLCVTSKELSAVPNETDAQKAARLTLLAKGGYNPVIAAQATKTKSVGYIGGVNVPLLVSFQKGFDAGVTATDSTVKIANKYLTQPPDYTGFNAPDKGKATAAGMFDAGADVVYAAAGGSGGGVFVAAKAAGTWAIGVDSDQYLSADAAVKDVILTSALKNVNVAVYATIDAAVKGTPLTGVQVYDLKNDGVGYSKSNPAVQPYEAKADAAAQAIIAGTVTVPN
jgi:basic membrane protein A